MASSENLAAVVNPWALRPSFQDPWISDSLFSRETQTLTTPISRSWPAADSDVITSFLDLIKSDAAPPTPTVSGLSAGAGSDPEAPAPRRRATVPPAGGKVSKRKSRAAKRNHTTYITADPENFRQMVQQVTGVRLGTSPPSQVPMAPVLKPEPQRPAGRGVVGGGAGLPTLDTSAFLLNHRQQSSGSGSEITGPGPLEFGPGLGPVGSDFDTFSTFPTLESWKAVM